MKLYHRNVYSHICNICDKGFHSLEVLHTHQEVHKGTFLKCDQCDTTFMTDCAKKRHLQDNHGKKKNLKCSHCGHVSYTPSTLYLHVKSCPKLPQVAQRDHGIWGQNSWLTSVKTTIGSNFNYYVIVEFWIMMIMWLGIVFQTMFKQW